MQVNFCPIWDSMSPGEQLMLKNVLDLKEPGEVNSNL